MHDLPEDQQGCSCCADSLKRFGKKQTRSELIYHPAYVEKVIHQEYAYECPRCKQTGTNQIVRAKTPPSALPKSQASSSLLARVVVQKMELSLPLYRQKAEWAKCGVTVTRRTLAKRVSDYFEQLTIRHIPLCCTIQQKPENVKWLKRFCRIFRAISIAMDKWCMIT